MRQAMTLGTRTIDKRTPGGRFDGRAYARGQAQRAHGRPVSTHPWRITRQISAPIQEPHVALVIDTSGSMSGYEYALGPIAWIISDGLRQIGGRCAIALFGSGAELLSDGDRPLRLVPGIRTGGGTAFAGDAIVAASDCLEMTNPRRPRLAYVLSDGGWYDTPAGVERIRWLADHGVPTIHIAIGTAPLSVEADRIVVITDPADALDQVAADTVDALRATASRRAPVGTTGPTTDLSYTATDRRTHMYLVPILLVVDAESPAAAQQAAEAQLGDRAVLVGASRRLSQIAFATAEFELRVYANRIELPPAKP